MKPSSPREELLADLSAFILGFASLWIQVVLIRRLMAAFTGNELIIGFTLAAWMVWTGLGSLVPARKADRLTRPGLALALVFAAAALAAVPAALATARVKEWMGLERGELAGIPELFLASLLLTGPVCALLGFGFNLSARMQKHADRAAGRAYRFEALGAFVSGVLLGVWFARPSPPLLPAAVVSAVLSGFAFALSRAERKKGGARAAEISSLLVFASALFFCFYRGHYSLDRIYERAFWRGGEALESFDSKFSYLAALREGDQITIFQDGSPAATFPDPARDEVFVHIPLSMVKNPGRVLILGGGFTGMAREILKHGVKIVDYVQLDPAWVSMERRWAPGFERLAADPRVNIILQDGRQWLKRDDIFYDAVFLNLGLPLTAGLNRFYTAEFFFEVRGSLMPGGVFALEVGRIPPNRMFTEAQLGLLSGVVHTAEAVFPRRALLPFESAILIAGDEMAELTTSAQEMERNLSARGIKSFYASSGMLGPELAPGLLADLDQKIKERKTPPDRDLSPRGYFYGIMLWAERASPRVARWIKKLASPRSAFLWAFPLLVLAAGFLLLGFVGKRQGEAALATLVSGFVGIVAEVCLLIVYQVLAGSVYFALSVLTSCFMVGLSAGAWAFERLGERGSLLRAEGLLCLFTAISALTAWEMVELDAGGVAAFWIISLLLLGHGFSAGALFFAAAKSSAAREGTVSRVAGLLNAAEHFGSAAGGAVAGAFLIPVLGILSSLTAALLCGLVLWAGSFLLSFAAGFRS